MPARITKSPKASALHHVQQTNEHLRHLFQLKHPLHQHFLYISLGTRENRLMSLPKYMLYLPGPLPTKPISAKHGATTTIWTTGDT